MKIVADSCCDIIPAMRKELGVSSVPLIMLLEGKEYIDDDNLDLPHFIEDMKNCKGKIGSSSPPPASYAEAFDEKDTAFAGNSVKQAVRLIQQCGYGTAI